MRVWVMDGWGGASNKRWGMYSRQTQTRMYISDRSTLERKTGLRAGSKWRMWHKRRINAHLNCIAIGGSLRRTVAFRPIHV